MKSLKLIHLFLLLENKVEDIEFICNQGFIVDDDITPEPAMILSLGAELKTN